MSQSGRRLPLLQSPEKTACGVAIATAAGAVLCGVCCVLPFALPAVALASSGTAIAWLASGYSWATSIAIGIVVAAWLWIAVKSFRAQARPSASTFYAMGIATAVLGLAVVWPRMEPRLIAFLKAQGSAAADTVPATAQGPRPSARQATTPQVTVELIAGSPSGPTASDMWVGLRFRLQERWHIYWRNPGDSGGPPTVTWQLPEGVMADDVVWPMPSRLPLGPLMNYGYEGDVVLPVRLKLEARARSAPSLPIRADVNWLVCREVCLSGKGTLLLQLPLAGTDRANASDWSRRIEAARATEPKPAPPTWRASARSEKEYFLLTVDIDRAAESAFFFPLVESQIDDSTKQEVRSVGKSIQLRLRKSNQLMKDPASLRGVLALASGTHFEINAPVGNNSSRGER
jgi:DsbC/DsbD-like thiol-disulfide interchange protein